VLRLKVGVRRQTVVAAVVADVTAVIESASPGGGPAIKVGTKFSPVTADGLTVGGFHYIEERRAAWTNDPDIRDRLNHLVVIGQHGRLVAICLTDPSRREAIVRATKDPTKTRLHQLQQIPGDLLNAAFVQGNTLTLWLSGVHRRTSVKADAKILSGLDLRDALDPLADQTYCFSAARSAAQIPKVAAAIGVTPRGSRVWLGPTRDWAEFCNVTRSVLSHLGAVTEPQAAPLPVLATAALDSGQVSGPYDAALVPPEVLLDDPNVNADLARSYEAWSRAVFRHFTAHGTDFDAEVVRDGQLLGSIRVLLDLTALPDITWSVTGSPASAGMAKEHQQLVQCCQRRDWLKVWFESGHTLADGQVFTVRFRDLRFQNVLWEDFSGFDVTMEKPSTLDRIGKESSLFCWVKNKWRTSRDGIGWLACDDGAGEKADFIHVDDRPSSRALTLIHVKGAHSDSRNRGISASAYEVVVAQAIKNLRHLDRTLLDQGLRASLDHRVGRLVWHKGRASGRAKMLSAMGKLGSNFARRVVILQPHITNDSIRRALAQANGGDAARLRQFDALLLGAEAACHGLGAELTVLGCK